MNRKRYATDLTDAQWAILEPLIPALKPGGRSFKWARREILNAAFYALRGGQAWRLLPHDLPPWQTVYHYVRQWRLDGTWEQVNTALRQQVRRRAGRSGLPSAGIVDSQSVKTTEKGGHAAMMAARTSMGVNATCSLIPWGWWSKLSSIQRMWLTATVASSCLLRHSRNNHSCAMSGRTRATVARSSATSKTSWDGR